MNGAFMYLDYRDDYKRFLADNGFDSPEDLYVEVSATFAKKKWPIQSRSQFWEPFYGRGTLSKLVQSWLGVRYKWYPKPNHLVPTKNKDGSYLSTKIVHVTGQRQLRLAMGE